VDPYPAPELCSPGRGLALFHLLDDQSLSSNDMALSRTPASCSRIADARKRWNLCSSDDESCLPRLLVLTTRLDHQSSPRQTRHLSP
jgi:hypothetical protein